MFYVIILKFSVMQEGKIEWVKSARHEKCERCGLSSPAGEERAGREIGSPPAGPQSPIKKQTSLKLKLFKAISNYSSTSSDAYVLPAFCLFIIFKF